MVWEKGVKSVRCVYEDTKIRVVCLMTSQDSGLRGERINERWHVINQSYYRNSCGV